MKAKRLSIYLLAALAMILSLTNAQSARAITPRGKNLAVSTPPLLVNIAAIELGTDHTCALTTGGAIKCWGANGWGQLGDGTYLNHLTPKSVGNLTSDISAISGGNRHTCAVIASGGIKCWGDNVEGQLGDGTKIERLTPVNVIGLPDISKAISTGIYHTCAITSTGGVKCWGGNENGQLGDGTNTRRLTPTDVIGLASGVIEISAGNYHSCALTSSGGVKCWGNTFSNVPTDVIGLTNGVIAISAGGSHTCALTSSGGVKCWGNNYHGQLGDGTNTNRPTPVNVLGLTSGVRSITTGWYHTCAVTSSNAAKCWGKNSTGQLGDGTTTSSSIRVNVVGLTSGISAIAAGNEHTCALTSNGKVKCWGLNDEGELGDGTNIMRKTPTNVIELDELSFRSIAMQDGYIWESTETSNIGLRANTTDTFFFVGDDNQNRQYRAILSFNTSALPDTAVVFSAAIRLRRVGWTGNEPDWSPMKADIRTRFFGDSVALLPSDFEAASSKANAGSFAWGLPYGTYLEAILNETALPYLNLTGITQFRIRYSQDDNNDLSADYQIFYSGEAAPSFRPLLIIQYYVP